MLIFLVPTGVSLAGWIISAQAADPFEVVEAVLCERVEERECVVSKKEELKFAAKDGQVCLLTRIKSDTDLDFFYVWYHQDRLRDQNISESEVVERFLRAFRGVGGESEKTIFQLPKIENFTLEIKLSALRLPAIGPGAARESFPLSIRANGR